jgi:uncharacterized protein involved in exopolysaccharide biosynthesis
MPLTRREPAGMSEFGAAPTAEDSLMSVVVRERRLLLVIPLVFLSAGLAYLFLRAPAFTSESRVRPVSNQANANRFAGLASQFGLALPGTQDPVRLYGEIAESHQVLTDVLTTRYPSSAEGTQTQATLLDILEIDGPDSEARLRRGVDQMRERIDVSTNDVTGTLRLRITLPDAKLAERVNRRVLEAIDTVSIHLRQGQAEAEREFVATRLAEARAELRTAEKALEDFNRSNRAGVQSAPHLQAEYSRLQRQVEFRQQVAVGLAQSLEQARIDAIRNTPILGILDPPEGTAKRAGRMRDILIWPIAGLIVAAAAILARDRLRRLSRQYPAEWAQLTSSMRRLGRGEPG